jgi:uncharacterized SAM-binding protein YcdF (DUF218 family)
VIRLALRWSVRVALALLVLVVGYLVVTAVQVWLTSRRYEPGQASAAVVMGSAEYNGVPSRDLRSRLNEALVLFRRHYVPVIVVTGGRKPGDVYTEGGVSASYLKQAGVPSPDVITAGGSDSWSNLADAERLLKARHATSVLIVTDPFHEARSMAIASELGLRARPTPTEDSPITGWATVPYFAKETVGVALGRIVGYQELSPIHAWIG